MQTSLAKKHDRSKMVLTIAFTVICIVYVLPIVIVLINSFKTNAAVNTDTFALPNEDTFVGWQNYIKGMTFGNYPFIKAVFYSLFITLVSSALILICTSMAAWYVARVGSLFSKIVYYLCVFSMVVPFQMVMFTLSRTAEQVKLPYFSFTSMAFAKIGLNTPWTIPIVYLGFGAGAHSCMGGRRFYYPPDTAAFLNDAAAPVMDGSCGAEDYLILQLRLRKGLSLDAYKKLYGKEFSTAQLTFVQNCVRAGYASFDGRTLALTPAGLIVQNSILAQLL